MRARVIARSPLNHIVRVWAPRWARRNTRSAVPYRQPSCVCAAGRLRVTRDVCVGCATELVPCANGWVGSRVRECGVRVLPYNEIMQEEDDLKLQLNIAGFNSFNIQSGRLSWLVGPGTLREQTLCRDRPHVPPVGGLSFPGTSQLSTSQFNTVTSCRRVVCRRRV
jgi:hypothetical protein